MKKLIFIGIAFTPFLMGYLLHLGLLTIWLDELPPLFLFGAVFLILWFVYGYFMAREDENIKKTTMLGHIVPLVVLLMIVIPAVFSIPYPSGYVGILLQSYYLPIINITSSIIALLGIEITTPLVVTVAFFLMVTFFYSGARFRL